MIIIRGLREVGGRGRKQVRQDQDSRYVSVSQDECIGYELQRYTNSL